MSNPTKNQVLTFVENAINVVNPTGDPDVPLSDSHYIEIITDVNTAFDANLDGGRKVTTRNKLTDATFDIETP
jgi:hypothetical protein